MEKSASLNLRSRPVPRRCQRIGPSETLNSVKQSMKEKSEKMKATDFVKDDYETAQMAINLVRGRTGVIYDDLFINHYCFWDRNYPESPDRYLNVIARCRELGLLDRCDRIPSRNATEEEILRVHSMSHLTILKETDGKVNYDGLELLSSKYDSIYFNNCTYSCAILAAGCAVSLVDAICTNQIYNGMAIIRPPGHHATRNEYSGYCFLNNVAIATKQAIEKHGLDRILIIDWDVHHGQGTQRAFYDEPRVIYFSIHRYENGKFWPQLRESDFDYIGEKSGKGFNFNIPLNETGAKDADYLAIFQQILIPLAYQYEPELIIISAGYDAALGCPEMQPELIIVSAGFDSALGDEKGEMELTPACYAHLLRPLMGLAKGKIAVILEGGYCLKSLAESAAITLKTLLGDPPPPLIDFGTPSGSVTETILNVIYAHRKNWPCFQIQPTYTNESEETENGKKNNTTKEQNLLVDPSDMPARKHMPEVIFLGPEKKKRPKTYETQNCYPVDSMGTHKEKLNNIISKTDLSCAPNRVAFIYSEAMGEHQMPSDQNHPEKPDRIFQIYKRFVEYRLLHRCEVLEPRIATEEELTLVHDKDYIEELKQFCELPKDQMLVKSRKYDSVYLSEKTYDCAALAAGCVLQVVDEVLFRRCRSGVAIVRPPGHHAEKDSACGFCFFNNVAIAAKYAIERHGLKRVLLFDWDIHHGNGTQHIFEEDKRVLYISLHRYNSGKFFPASKDADYNKVGFGEGQGYNVNIPWNRPGGGISDGDYICAFHSIIMPIVYQFDPELVLVSAGFDACVNDPIGNCDVSPEAFAHMTHWLSPLAGGRTILCLEGGYNTVSISYAMVLCTKALLGDPLPSLTTSLTPSPLGLETIRKVLFEQEKYWWCLRFNKFLPEENVLTEPTPTPEAPKGLTDLLADVLEMLELTSRAPDSNYKSEEANGGGRRNNPRRLPIRDSDPENGAGRVGRPTLVDYLSENMQRLLNEEMFAVVPLPGCPHLSEVQAVPQDGINVQTPCTSCETDRENWICLVCYSVYCGRYVNQHMMIHNEETSHPLTLSFTDLSVWCYVCEAYIDNMVLYPAKNAAHRSKFGVDLEWSYGVERQPPVQAT